MKNLILAAILATSVGAAHTAVREEPVSYSDGDTGMKGMVVYDDAASTKRPGIIVVHEWWGVTSHVREEARRLAGQGYTAFVADMYGDGKTADNPKDAGALAGSVRKDPAEMQSRFNAAKDALGRHATVDSKQIRAVGFCFGGSVVLDMARAGSGLLGVAAFHAGLGAAGPQATPGKVSAKVLVLYGADDPVVKPEAVREFRQEMASAGVDYRYIEYPGAVHAFTNPEATEKGKRFNLPLAYHAEADRQSKAEADKFFAALFRK